MFLVRQTDVYETWLKTLRDQKARAKILIRMDRLAAGNAGDCKSVKGGVIELRIDYGPGYRVYFTRRGEEIVLLLCGGDKTTQASDIKCAHAMAKDFCTDTVDESDTKAE